MSPELNSELPRPSTDPDELSEIKANILDQWRRLSPEPAAALMVEQLKDLMERGVIPKPETGPAFKPFRVISVCRADMIDYFSNEEIAQFDDSDMKRLADTMGDWYQDESYWHDLETIGRIILEEKNNSTSSNAVE